MGGNSRNSIANVGVNMSFRNNLALRSRQHRINQKWLFGFIFVTTILAICWLLL